MKAKINTYLALLIITLAAAGAMLLIVHVATSTTFSGNIKGSAGKYQALQQSILNQ